MIERLDKEGVKKERGKNGEGNERNRKGRNGEEVEVPGVLELLKIRTSGSKNGGKRVRIRAMTEEKAG